MGVKKVTKDMVNEMNRLVSGGVSKAEVARRMKLSIGSVMAYVTAHPPEKKTESEVWKAPWMQEWDKVRKQILKDYRVREETEWES